MRVIDKDNPGREAFDVGEQWWEEMKLKYPNRFQKVEAPVVVVVPKKKIEVPAAVVEEKKDKEVTKKEVTSSSWGKPAEATKPAKTLRRN